MAERGLQVRIAGVGASKTAWALRRFGSLLPALPGLKPPHELRHLALFNTFRLWTVLVTFGLAFPVLLKDWEEHYFPHKLSRQAHLARNAQRVLRVMLQKEADRDSAGFAERLRSELPWLPAYDRRDVLAVRHALNRLSLSTDEDNGDDEYASLAFSAYVAATLYPSSGDPVGGMSLRQWLDEKNIPPPRGTEAEASTWMDGTPTPTSAVEARLSLKSLDKLGWRWERGSSCILLSPLGDFHVQRPSGTLWRADGMRRLPSVPWPTVTFAVFFATIPVIVLGAISTFAAVVAEGGIAVAVARGVLAFEIGVCILGANAVVTQIWLHGALTSHAGKAPHTSSGFRSTSSWQQFVGFLVTMLFWPLPAMVASMAIVLGVCVWVTGSFVDDYWGLFVPPNVPAGPVAELALAEVAKMICWNCALCAAAVSHAFHMARQDACFALSPPNDLRDGYLV